MPTQQTPATRVEAKPAANPDTDYKIGQEFKLGDYTYRITNFTLTSRVGNEFSREVAAEGEQFVIVYFTIRNDTNKTQQVLADDLEIKDGQGRQFTNDSNASTALMMSGGKKDFFLREIQPSLTGKGVTVFRVPADVAKQSMVLVVPEKGLFSSKKMTVLLTKEEQHGASATEAEYLNAMTKSIAKNKNMIEWMAKHNLGPDYPAKQAQVIIDDAKKLENEGEVTAVQYWEAANIWLEMGATPRIVGKLRTVFADTLIGSIDEPSMRGVSDHELPRLIGQAILGKRSALEKLRLGDLKNIKSTPERQDRVIQALQKRYKGANRKAKAEAPKP